MKKDNAILLKHFLAQGKIALEPASFLYQAPSPLPEDWDFGRVEGMLLGLAIGNALGKTTESLLPVYRKHTYGEIRDYLPNRYANGRPVGLPSDDSQMAFWTLEQLLEKAKSKTNLHAKISPGKENWISAGAGKTGLGFNYVVRMDDALVELYIDRGEGEWNKRVFNALLQHKLEIEDLFGGPLDWQLLPDKKASRIRFVIPDYGLKDQDHWDELQERLIEAMIKLDKAFRPFIRRIDS